MNDYATAVRIFEGIGQKVENQQQYKAYLDEFAGVRKELGKLDSTTGNTTAKETELIVLFDWSRYPNKGRALRSIRLALPFENSSHTHLLV